MDLESLKPLVEALEDPQTAIGKALKLLSGSGQLLRASSRAELIHKSLEDLFLRTRDTVKLYETLATILAVGKCRLFVLRDAPASAYLATQLQSFDQRREVTVIDISAATNDANVQYPSNKSPIAVVGMAGRFPEAADPDRLWELLQAGRDVHRTIPSDRFDYRTHSDPAGKRKNTSKSPYGCFINDPGLFDHRFFNMSPKEAAQTDPAQRLTILTAYEALEMAGFVPNRTTSSRSDRVATFYGQASDDWRETNSSQDIDTYFVQGGIRAFGPGRINYHLKFSGPSYSVDTACSSSFAAIHMACNSLLAGDCDTAIAGGANVLTNPDIFAGLSRGHFLSIGPCKTFDADADGYCRADGVGCVILKRLEDAENDNDNILGLILGVGTNHSADAVSITHPHAPTQAALYQSILSNSNIDAHDVCYVEMHGTGTAAGESGVILKVSVEARNILMNALGDYNEMLSVSDVFAPHRRHKRSRPLYVSSIKPNIGHGEAAAGISSLIKVLLMLRNNAIPPHVGIKGVVNPAFPTDLETRNIHIPFVGKDWLPMPETPRTAFMNNFSAAGGNTAVLLREYRSPSAKRQAQSRSIHIISVSAKTIRSLRLNMARLAAFIRNNANTNLADLSYTLTARRIAYSYRKTFAVSQLVEARDALLSSVDQPFCPIASKTPNVVFTFTGQGSLYSSLARTLLETCESFRRDVLEFNSIAVAHGLPSVLTLLDGSAGDDILLSPVLAHVGQVCVQLALARLWISWGLQPSAVIGHSLGEYPALVVAGVLSASDMIYLVGRRAQLLEEKCVSQSHGMLVVNTATESLAPYISRTSVEIACVNSPKATVLGGPRERLEACAQILQADGITCRRLPVEYAYHTAQMDSILAESRQNARQVTYATPQIPVLSPLFGSHIEPGSNAFNAEYLCRHSRETVNFRDVILSVGSQREWNEDGVWLEVGPHPTCTKFVLQSLGPAASVLNSLRRGYDPWQTMSVSLCSLHDRGSSVDWEQYHRGFENCYKLIDLPAYAWDLSNFWIDYRHDWSLTKGDRVQFDREIPTAPSTSGLATTTVHTILEKKVEGSTASFIAETDFSEPHLALLAAGHRVNGVSLCPSSLYADIALTVAKHLHQSMHPGQPIPALDVCDMQVDKPFILDQKNDVLFRISATASDNDVQLQLYTTDKRYQSIRTDHACCIVRFQDSQKWRAKWNRKSYLIKERLAALDTAAVTGSAHRIQRDLVYKLFSNFVEYDEDYRCIQQVHLDSHRREASATVVLKPTGRGSVYEIPPTWIDSFCHLTGVILNASDAVNSNKFVYISHGWKSMRLLGDLHTDITYRTYTRMQEIEANIMEGDVWIFNAAEVVGVVKGVKFQRIPRKVIDILLPKPVSRTAAEEALPAIHHMRPQNPQVNLEQTSATSYPKPSTTDLVLQVISSECGVDIAELVDGCTFASLGIDSLLSLEILAKLRESVGVNLRPHFFLKNDAIRDLKAQLLEMAVGPPRERLQELPMPAALTFQSTALQTPATYSDASLDNRTSEKGVVSLRPLAPFPPSSVNSDLLTSAQLKASGPKAASYLMSGNAKAATKYLFLFPDGSGSATSYMTLPPLASNTAVFALNCPFMTNPSSWQSGIAAVTKLYLEEIRRRQPNGPYNFGGWSAGGVLAYEAAFQVQKSGGSVDRLILIDSPCPLGLPPMPIKMFAFLDSIGLLGSGHPAGAPKWLIPHFEATVRNLESYLPLPIPPGKEPAATAIWARRGVTSASGGRRPAREPGDPEVMEWLLEDRTDFGYNGWDSLVGARAIACEVMDGHHFSMTTEQVSFPRVGCLYSLLMT